MPSIENAPRGAEPAEPASLRRQNQGGAAISALAIPTAAPAITVADITAAYLNSVELRHLAGKLSDDYASIVQRYCADFLKDFGTQRFDQCSADDLTRWLLSRRTWTSDSTRQNALNAVIGCFNWACDTRRLIPYSPYRRPKDLRIRPRPREPITPEEYRQFMDHARNRKGKRHRPAAAALRVAVYFLWRCGCRTCEMRHLLKTDIDWQKCLASMDHHKTDFTGDPRVFGLDARLLRLFRLMDRNRKPSPRPCTCAEAKHRQHKRDDHVFLNSRGQPWTRDSFGKLFRTFARLAGIQPHRTAYCLRHGFCTNALRGGAKEFALAQQMGHADTKLIRWYGRRAKLNPEYLHDVVNRANG